MSTAVTPEDWRAIQAERYRQSKLAQSQQQKQAHVVVGSTYNVFKRFLTSIAPNSPVPGKQHASSGLRGAVQQTCTAARWLYSRTTRRHVIALLAILVALVPSAAHHWQLQQENKLLNKGPMPDCNNRKAHEHRLYMLSKKDFVNVYAAKQTIKVNSSKVEGGWGLEPVHLHKGGSITRCATTQYATVTYFCGKSLADTEYFGRLPSFNTSRQLADWVTELQERLQADNSSTSPTGSIQGNHSNNSISDVSHTSTGVSNINNISSSNSASKPQVPLWPEYIFRCNLYEATDPSLGHTFVIHFLPDGFFQVYQSFIGHYTLQYYLEDHGPMSMEQFFTFLNNIHMLEAARDWTKAEDKAYEHNFLVSLRKSSSKGGPLGGWQNLHKRKGDKQHIKFIAEPVCIAGLPVLVSPSGSMKNGTKRVLDPLSAYDGEDYDVQWNN